MGNATPRDSHSPKGIVSDPAAALRYLLISGKDFSQRQAEAGEQIAAVEIGESNRCTLIN